MKRLFLLLLLFLLSACTNIIEPSTTWEKTDYKSIDGVVEIATGWAKSHLCTGSLIDEQMVLTAAHCAVFPAEDLYVVYGCSDIRSESCTGLRVKQIFRHPKYKKDFLASHDLAIIIPEKPIPLKLAKISSRTEIEEGLSAKAVGFGQRNTLSGILYEGRGRVTRDYTYELVAHMNGSLDPNPGDSGGPLLILEDDEFKIIGVLSRSQWTETDKNRQFEHTGYAIYTKPVMYLDWIEEIKNSL